MDSTSALVTFLIVSFCLAAVVILRRDSIPQPFRKFIAVAALIMVVSAFAMLVVTFFTAGT